MFEKLSYYLWHAFFGAVIVAVPLQFMGLLPGWATAALAYTLFGIGLAVVVWWLVRLFIWR